MLPVDLRDALASHPQRPELIEIVLDLGRRPEARFQNGQVRRRAAALPGRRELSTIAGACMASHSHAE